MAGEGLAPETTMRTHLQGTFLLIVLLLVFWWTLSWAVPILDSAVFGEDGAVVARAPLETDDRSAADRGLEPDQPLDGNEVADLQSALTQLGYSPGPIDGIMGELTRQAIDEAKVDVGLAEASDRRLLETLNAALEALISASDPDTPGNSGTAGNSGTPDNSGTAGNSGTPDNSGTAGNSGTPVDPDTPGP